LEVIFSPKARTDLEFWQKSGQKKIQLRISRLLTSITESPFDGLGKPEPLKHNLSGLWSRRITNEHRLVYQVLTDRINVISVRYHYDK